MSSIALVANYGSSSENDSEDDATHIKVTPHTELESGPSSVNYFANEPEIKKTKKKLKKKEKAKLLINPLRGNKPSKAIFDASSSVFYNPFLEEQEAKNSILEKHVKLTINTKNADEINGKKICWNYRKGRCKFGHTCKFAHDSDLISNGTQNKITSSDDVGLASNVYNTHSLSVNECEQEPKEIRKRKPGLAEGMIPNKKSRQIYNNILSKEKPWKKKL